MPHPARLLAIGVLAFAGLLAIVALAQRDPRPPAALYQPKVVASAPRAPALAPIRVRAPMPAAAPSPTASQTPFVIRHVMTLPGPFRHGNHYWNETGAPATGPLVITVDLAAQSLSVFRAGHEIGTAVMLYGAQEKPTPLGVFTVTQKDADHVSNLYGAPMPYMLRLTNDGISIHGADVIRDAATHGCVGVPTAFARKLFGAVKLGDRVIVTNGERLKVGDAVTG